MKELLAFAQLVKARYRRNDQPRDIRWNKTSLSDLEDIERKIDRANQLGFELARQRLIADYEAALEQIRSEIVMVQTDCDEDAQFIASTSEIYRDLVTLREEFENFTFSTDNRILSVVTEPIELNDIYLGSFKIRLDIVTLTTASKGTYEVIALDPNPAASNDNVNHPHVEGTTLCEGDAKQPIKLALQQSRLLDFFQLVDRVLKTYNPSSAYCSLDEWNELTCCDCGSLSDPDESYCCEKCESRTCDSCVIRCADCEESFCCGCVQVCGGCLDDICGACVKPCDDCDQTLCSGCFPEDNERCQSCDEKNNENDEIADACDDNDESESVESKTPVHADGVGQVAVFA
jgi:hypothetical protein